MKKKKKSGKKSWWKWLIVLVVLAAGAAGSKWAFDQGYLENIPVFNTSKEPVVLNTVTVERGTILRTTEGNGAIEAADTRTAEAPFDLKVSEVKAENGDLLKEGDLIATLDTDSIQEQIDIRTGKISELNTSIRRLDKSGSEDLDSPISGRIKRIFVEEGDLLTDVVERYGGLMEINPTGRLKVEIPAGDRLKEGDRVTVLFEDYEEDGIVMRVEKGLCTIEFDDDPDYEVDVEARVEDKDGNLLGRGPILTSYPYLVEGAYGTARDIEVEVNERVSSGDTLLTRRNYSYNADYKELLKQRQDLQEEILELRQLAASPEIRAEGDGILSELALTDGCRITEGASVYTIIFTDRFWLKAEIDELDIADVRAGQAVQVVFDAYPETEIEGQVEKVSALGSNKGGVATYTVTISVPGSENLKTAMSATATIELERRDDVLLIPVDAVDTVDGKKIVKVVDGETLREQEVTLGLVNYTMAEVTEGLAEGQEIENKGPSTELDFYNMTFGGRSRNSRR